MKKIEVFKKENPNEVIAVCNDLSEASETIINECQDDDDLTVFDFDTREVEEKEPAEICDCSL